ncbi:MAG: hypothetical protein ACYYK0_07600 [Candidatus Eutrophobiaceae bacterium]
MKIILEMQTAHPGALGSGNRGRDNDPMGKHPTKQHLAHGTAKCA